MADDYRQILTDKLIEQLETGTAPWQKPWDAKKGIARLPYNPTTGKEYRGANSLYLSMHGHEDPRWCTYKQAAAEGWQVRKGEKGALVEYWKFAEEQPQFDEKGRPVIDEKTGKQKTVWTQLERPKIFRAVVFNASQMDNVPELKKEPRQYDWNPIDRAESILKESGARIFHDQNDRAFYTPMRDEIHLPDRGQFPDQAAYYSTALHELGHWTGHESRLKRDLSGGFGTSDYAKEELRAELASYFLADKLGIPHDPGQHASYVKSWVKVLKDDKNEIFRAARDAEGITEYVLQLDRTRELGQDNGLEQGKASTLEPIRRGNFEGAGRNEVQEAVARAVEANPEKFIEKFKELPLSFGGRFISADTFKETFDQYKESNESRNIYNAPVHNSAAVLASEQLRRVLSEKPEPGREDVILLTGIPGAGKTSAVVDQGKLSAGTHAVYEGQLADPSTAIAKVQQVIDAGFKPVIVAVHTLPERALDNTLRRFEEVGRGASLNTMAKIQGGLPAGLAAVLDKFGEDVKLHVLDRRNFDEPQQLQGWEHLSTLESEGNHEQIKQRLEQHLESRRDGLSQDAYLQAAGKAPIVRERRDGGRDGREHEGNGEGRGAAGKDREEPGLKQLAAERTPLNVPFKEKEAAKALGAKWDKAEKTWYAPPGTDLAPLAQWRVQDTPDLKADIADVPKRPHEVTFAEFAATATVNKLENHGRQWEVVYDGQPIGFADSSTPAEALREAHAAAVNNAVYAHLPDAPQWMDYTMPPPAVIAEYPELKTKFPEVFKEAKEPAQEVKADKTWLAVPFKEKTQAKDAGAKWDKEAKAWYAPPGADLDKLQKWMPKQEVSREASPAQHVDPAASFGNAIRAAGLVLEGDPQMDGTLHRIPVADGKRGNRDGAYVGYLDGRPAGYVQNFQTGERTNWKLEGPELSAEARAELAAQSLINKQARAAKLGVQHEDAAAKAQGRWDRATEMTADEKTPYLERKQVPAIGLRRDGDNLLVPVRDIDGKVWAVQTIFPEKKELVPGTAPIDKVFTKEAKKEGNFHLLGEIQPGQPVITVEGYATGASIHKATGHAVAVAFDSGNLDAVVGALKSRYPTNPHFIGADDDRFPKPGHEGKNPGLQKAIEASHRHEVGVIVPAFSGDGRFTDFNDLHVSEGLGAVKAQVEAGVSKSMEQSRQQAEKLAHERLGDGAEVTRPGASTRHTGKVLDVNDYHATQETSTRSATVHQIKDLDKLPEPGKVTTIQYQQGRGKVTEKAVDKSKELQR